jgi:hypothetical protein
VRACWGLDKILGVAGTASRLEGGGKGCPFVFEGAGGDGLTGAAVPVVGVEVVPYPAVEIGVEARGFGGFDVLRDLVGAGPVAVGVVPECLEKRWEIGEAVGGELAQVGGRHEGDCGTGWW